MKLFYPIFILLFFILLLFSPLFVKGIYLKEVFINEIAWMGTNVSYNNEWIELYNSADNDINLDGWVLKADDGAPEINLTGQIPAQGFYLIERTDDETIPGVAADLIYAGALENSGENLKLFDNLNNLVDEVNCSEKWLAGNNTTKQTMEKTSADWQTSKEPGGTPKMANNKLEEARPPLAQAPESMEVGPPLIYPAGIVFNEILPSPEGPDETEEWIEIFNQNNFEIGLSSWQIRDKEGKITTYTFPEEIKITALGYLILKRPETKIILNNNQDSLNLLYPNGETADSISFEKSPLGQSYNKTQTGWKWSTILTPGEENIIPTPKPLEQKTQTKGEPAFAPLASGASAGKETAAAIGEKIIKPLPENFDSRSLLPLLIAFAVAIFSAGIILFLKKTRVS